MGSGATERLVNAGDGCRPDVAWSRDPPLKFPSKFDEGGGTQQVFVSLSPTSEGLRGETLIDVGCGPTIYQLLSACEHFQEIIALDYTDQNRRELEKWLKKEQGAFDWRPVVEYVCELEGEREKWAEKEEKLRQKVRQVLKCDVTKANPTDPVSLPPADCVVSTLCLEAACKDLATFRSALRNVGALLKPGGHLVMVTVLRETYYAFNNMVFSCLHLEKNVVEEAVEGAGFDVRFSEVQPCPPGAVCADCEAVLSLVARKRAPISG
ncbi:nicotinamide n-methyltransferase [Limosa lapponica baueri]|uniref:Nicotinamide n-methyltransferase n=1 Tax=Limosa lapponica baueri TaxID=1758121 RepID=A0A2I0TMS6_LIMLA|nr:nicotinamide n-methyltransferase [Limosa lapponica baueri]